MPYSAKIALLGHTIDYAGMFPPAQLPFEKAVEKAAHFRRESRHPWLMSKVVFSCQELRKIRPALLYDRGAIGQDWLFTALSSEDLAEDMRFIGEFNQMHLASSCRCWVLSYETKHTGEKNFFETVLQAAKQESLVSYFELEVQANGISPMQMDELVSAYGLVAGLRPGVKIRTGGTSPPTPKQLAQSIWGICKRSLRFKATQGLHEAVSHGCSFGFVNLFAALAFAQNLGADRFTVKDIQDCLESSEKDFQFRAKNFQWKHFPLDADAIESARSRHGGTFGCCSLDEPDESLEKYFPGERP